MRTTEIEASVRTEPLPWMAAANARLGALNDLDGPLAPDSLTVFFPAYNDESTIGSLIEYSLAMLDKLRVPDFEILVVNDGSRDATGRILQEWANSDPRVRVITHEQNRGYGGALISGFAHARKEWVFYTDGDGQYDPTDLLRLLPVGPGCDVVQGYKIKRSDPWYRSLCGRTYHRVASLAFGLRISDVDCDFRLMRREALADINLESQVGFICTEMMKKLQDSGQRIREVPVPHYPRMYGRSMFFTPRRVARVLPEFLRFWLRLVVGPALSRFWPRRAQGSLARDRGNQAVLP